MSEPGQGEVRFNLKYERGAGEEGRRLLDEINRKLKGGPEITVGAAKDLILNRNFLIIPPATRTAARIVLAGHYGFAEEADPEVDPIGVSRIERDLAAAIEYERFDVDPSLPLAEYRSAPLREMLASFSDRPVEDIRFHTFADASRATVIMNKADSIEAEAGQERQRILDMTPEEFDEYRGGPLLGLIWAQRPRAQDVYTNRTRSVEGLRRAAGYVDGLGFVRKEQWGDMLRRFLDFESTKQLNTNSTVNTTMSRALSAEMVLVPKAKPQTSTSI